ncbi:hypothetical protein MMC24_002212 [Lignoscripta atroalba]|nr:hypothetical protein [Lignoscripta atroalba]
MKEVLNSIFKEREKERVIQKKDEDSKRSDTEAEKEVELEKKKNEEKENDEEKKDDEEEETVTALNKAVQSHQIKC